jgi:hypothetical protein
LRVLPPNVPLSVEDGNPVLTEMYFPSEERVADAVERLVAGRHQEGA